MFFAPYLTRKSTDHFFFFQESTNTGVSYLEMISLWLVPQLQEDSDDFVWVQDGAPPHWHHYVREYLDENLPRRWIGREADMNNQLLRWPPRSPDLNPCDFFTGLC